MNLQANIRRPTSNSQCATEVIRSTWDGRQLRELKTGRGIFLSLCALVFLAGCSTSSAPATARAPNLPSHSEVIKVIKQLVEAGQFETAERAAREVLRTEPDNGAAAYYLAFAEEGRRRNGQGTRTPQPQVWIPTIPPQPIY